ncbi:hypothetical protein AALA80_19050 [Oscillospiraceae bacterium 50-60]
MLKIAFFLLGVSICAFAWIMLREPRTLWSGVSLLGVLLCSAVTMFFLLTKYADWLAGHDLLMNILVTLLLLTAGCALVFPVIFIVTLFIEGVKVIRHEGLKPANLLTMLFSVLLYLYLAGDWRSGKREIGDQTLCAYQSFRRLCAGAGGRLSALCGIESVPLEKAPGSRLYHYPGSRGDRHQGHAAACCPDRQGNRTAA